MRCVIDTSTLISLAKIHVLDLIMKLDLKVIVPSEIYAEAILRGGEKGYLDADLIKNFINLHSIRVVDVKTGLIAAARRMISKALAKGDANVIALAMREKVKTILTDDDGLGKIAYSLGYTVKASPDLLLDGLRKKVLSVAEFESYMRGLVIENRLNSVVAELYLMEGEKYVKG